MPKKMTIDDVVNNDWQIPENITWEIIVAASMLTAARDLRLIRRMLEGLGRDGIHEVIREQRLQVPALRAARLSRAKSKANRKAAAKK